MKYQTDDLRIVGVHELTPPVELHREYPNGGRDRNRLCNTARNPSGFAWSR